MTVSLHSIQFVLDIRQYLRRVDGVSQSVPIDVPIDVPIVIIDVAALRRKRTVESPRVVSQGRRSCDGKFVVGRRDGYVSWAIVRVDDPAGFVEVATKHHVAVSVAIP